MQRTLFICHSESGLTIKLLFAVGALALGAWTSAALAQEVGPEAGQETAPEEAAEPAVEPAAEKPAPQRESAAPPPKDLGEGRLIQVRLPLVGNADAHYESAIRRAVEQLTESPRPADRRPVLILELVPAKRQGGYGEGTDFERALSLARFLTSRELAPVKTVAYIPQTIKGHGVLIALACEEIVMHPEAELGEAGIDESDLHAIEPGVVSWYQQISSSRRTVPEAIALGMLDRNQEVLKVETDQGIEFVLGDQLDELRKNHTIVSEETLVPRGSLGLFTGRDGREYGFVKLLASNRDALARGLGLPADAVIEDQSLVGDWRPVMINLEGPLTPRQVRQIQTLIGSEIKDNKVNWIGLRIDSAGGDLDDCLRLASSLAELDANEVRTVAYVPLEASGGAALIALACDQVVLQPNARLGGKGTVEIDRPTLDAARVTIRESLAKNTDHSWSLLAAMVDPEVKVFAYRNLKTGDVRYFSAEEAAAQPNADDWRKGVALSEGDQPLQLASKQAEDLGVAWQVVDNFDELKQLYGFEDDPRVAEPNSALELVEALSSPALAILLITIGIVGIYIELHSPGIGVGGFVSALAFMLFFWSKFLHGTAGWLEVLLFVGGTFFLLLELLVLPGFGIFGLGGGLMILSSLVLASQTFVLPQTESQLAELRNSLMVVAAATVCIVAASLALRRYLPQTALFRTLTLAPPAEAELADLSYRESVADFSYLVGEQGTAATNLMPSGKAEFNGQLIDVIADRPPIDRGSPIVVVEAHANRVLVRAVES